MCGINPQAYLNRIAERPMPASATPKTERLAVFVAFDRQCLN
jgi:hypothetical protein